MYGELLMRSWCEAVSDLHVMHAMQVGGGKGGRAGKVRGGPATKVGP